MSQHLIRARGAPSRSPSLLTGCLCTLDLLSEIHHHRSQLLVLNLLIDLSSTDAASVVKSWMTRISNEQECPQGGRPALPPHHCVLKHNSTDLDQIVLENKMLKTSIFFKGWIATKAFSLQKKHIASHTVLVPQEQRFLQR